MPVVQDHLASAPFAAADIKIDWAIFGLAFLLMIAGLTLFFWGLRRRDVPHQRTANPIVWALVAMGPALLLFSVFPNTTAEGQLGAFTLGGAFAAYALVWYFGTRLAREGIDADAHVEQLRADLAAARNGRFSRAAAEEPALRGQDKVRYRAREGSGAELVILTGDLLNVRGVDVWVNPENTNMQPARFHDRSVSALVRYYAAETDEDGDPVRDVVGEALADAMRRRGKSVVPSAAVVPTGPGALAKRGVKRIYHVAAVEGSPGGGYRPVDQLGRCITRALERMDHEDEAEHDVRSIIFPMLGTGAAGGDPAAVAADLVAAASDYLTHREDTRVQCVYLLAYRRSELFHWLAAADGCAQLKRLGGSVEHLLVEAH